MPEHIPTPKIQQPYLLVSPIPMYLESDGVWLDPLWHHDLVEHLTYLQHFTLVAPRSSLPHPSDSIRVIPPADVQFRAVPIPELSSIKAAMCRLPALCWVLWSEIGRARIVHSGVAGWPISLGWIANPIALIRGRKLVIVVESAFWRIPPGQQPTWKARVRCWLTESLARWSVNRAHLCLFSQPAYRESLHTHGRGKAYVTPATWINDEAILSDEQAVASWDQKERDHNERVSVLFAGRLVAEKGVALLLESLRQLDRDRVPLRVDIIGEGPLRSACTAAAGELTCVRTAVLDPVPYGPAFFALLRQYDGVVVPSVSDEQPRIVFDAFSQAVPVLAARTDGLAACVAHGETGILFPPGSATQLAATLRSVNGETTTCRRMGMQALRVAHTLTHREMHRTRWKVLVDCFGA